MCYLGVVYPTMHVNLSSPVIIAVHHPLAHHRTLLHEYRI